MNNVVNIKMKERFGSFLSNGSLAAALSVNELFPNIKAGNTVILDMSGVENMTDSFGNALIANMVKANGEVDREAFSRGTSVYFVDKVVPMLPEVLSNGCCSLNAGEDKYALSAIMTLDADGEIVSAKFAKTIIRSAVRGVYSSLCVSTSAWMLWSERSPKSGKKA